MTFRVANLTVRGAAMVKQKKRSSLRRNLASSILLVVLAQISITPSFGNVDLQADLNRIVAAINKFDANSSRTNSASTIADIRSIFASNALILSEISSANSIFRRNLKSVKSQIPTKDTKDTPKFRTLMNLSKGYKDWVYYQRLNQALAEKCLKKSGSSYNSFLTCSINDLPKTMQNERIGRGKLQAAWNAWKQWQVKFGHA